VTLSSLASNFIFKNLSSVDYYVPFSKEFNIHTLTPKIVESVKGLMK
jgi:hypothetical protein